jgi:hypothetical protein
MTIRNKNPQVTIEQLEKELDFLYKRLNDILIILEKIKDYDSL